MNTLAELYATSGFYDNGEPWPVGKMTDSEFVAVIKSLRLKAFPMGGHQDDPIVRDGVVLA